jgi:hypothetical protein
LKFWVLELHTVLELQIFLFLAEYILGMLRLFDASCTQGVEF